MRSKYLFQFLMVFVSAGLSTSCFSDSRTLKNGYTLPLGNPKNVQKVIDKAVDNLVFVKGGSFMMGDGGYLYKGNKVHWSPWSDNFPAHKVTLDSYSISKYEVTFWEYDVYTDLLKKEPVGLWFQHKYVRKDNFPAGVIKSDT